MGSDFFSVAFQSALTLAGILFAAFGFLYAAYCQYTSLPTPARPLRAPVVNTLMFACRLTCVVITLDALLAIYILMRTVFFSSLDNFVLSLGFSLIMAAIVAIGWFLTARM